MQGCQRIFSKAAFIYVNQKRSHCLRILEASAACSSLLSVPSSCHPYWQSCRESSSAIWLCCLFPCPCASFFPSPVISVISTDRKIISYRMRIIFRRLSSQRPCIKYFCLFSTLLTGLKYYFLLNTVFINFLLWGIFLTNKYSRKYIKNS